MQVNIPFAVCQAKYVPIDVINTPIAPIAISAACSFSPRSIVGATAGKDWYFRSLERVSGTFLKIEMKLVLEVESDFSTKGYLCDRAERPCMEGCIIPSIKLQLALLTPHDAWQEPSGLLAGL